MAIPLLIPGKSLSGRALILPGMRGVSETVRGWEEPGLLAPGV